MPDDAFWVYVVFNRFEGTAWMVIAVVLPFVVKRETRRQNLSVFAASVGFVLFGVTDFLEAPLQGRLPAWLWVAKILCAAFILSCRYSYVGWDKFRLKNRYLVFGLGCLASSLGVIFLQHWLYD